MPKRVAPRLELVILAGALVCALPQLVGCSSSGDAGLGDDDDVAVDTGDPGSTDDSGDASPRLDTTPGGDATDHDAMADSAPPSDGGFVVPGPMGAACKPAAPKVTTKLASGAPIAATIHATTVVCATASDFVGTNFEAFPGWGADVTLGDFEKKSYQASGMQLFRYPGGEPGEWSDLLYTGTCSDGSTANWGAPAYTDVWSFAKSAGLSALMLQTNPTTQSCAATPQDASGAHAAALAADAAKRGVSTVFEVGNEPEISAYFKANGGQSAYIDKFIEHATAIHGVAPKAEVYGPVLCGLGGNCSFPTTWDSGWLDAFLAKTGDKATGAGKSSADGVSFHVYWHPEWSYSDLGEAKIDKYGFGIYWSQTVMPYLHTLIAKYDSRNLPIAISEISIGNGIAGDSTQTQNMFTVLGTLDTVASFAISGVRSFQWFDANAAGPSDFWMITKTAPRPIFYAFAAWAKMGTSLVSVEQDGNPHDVSIFASRRADGALAVLLINKTDSTHDVTLTFEGASVAGKSASTTTVAPTGAATETAKSITYAGTVDPSPTSLPAPKTEIASAAPKVALSAFSAAVVVFGP